MCTQNATSESQPLVSPWTNEKGEPALYKPELERHSATPKEIVERNLLHRKTCKKREVFAKLQKILVQILQSLLQRIQSLQFGCKDAKLQALQKLRNLQSFSLEERGRVSFVERLSNLSVGVFAL